MLLFDDVWFVEVGNGLGDFDGFEVTSGGEAEVFGSFGEEFLGGGF